MESQCPYVRVHALTVSTHNTHLCVCTYVRMYVCVYVCMYVCMCVCAGQSAEVYRGHLGSYGITGELSLRPVASLSGGQKSRLAFSLITASRCVRNLVHMRHHTDMHRIPKSCAPACQWVS